MILALFLAVAPISISPPRLEDPPKPPVVTEDPTQAALAELKSAFEKTDAGPRLRAIQNAADVDDAEVVRYIGRGLTDKDLSVQGAAIEALRFNPNAKAFEELNTRAKSKAAKEDTTVYAKLLRAVGQRGDPRAIDVLNDNPWSAPDAQVIQARIYGLGNVRTKEGLKALTDFMEIAGVNKIEPFMKDFRIALWSLTGADQGTSRDLWLNWYRENKSKVKISPRAPTEPPELARRWSSYWAKPGAEGEGGEKGKRRDGEGKDDKQKRDGAGGKKDEKQREASVDRS